MKRSRQALLAVALLAGGGAPAAALPSTQTWGPNGNGTLKHQDDMRWLDFHDAQVAADRAAGHYTARFSAMLMKMDGHDLVITGYMLPVGTAIDTTHFVLTRRSATCPFCPPNEPTEAIEVFSQRFVRPTQAPITVQGRLHLVASSDQGLFFRIDAARIL